MLYLLTQESNNKLVVSGFGCGGFGCLLALALLSGVFFILFQETF
jgi:hypothetical protein